MEKVLARLQDQLAEKNRKQESMASAKTRLQEEFNELERENQLLIKEVLELR